MKFIPAAFATIALLAATVNGSPMMRQVVEGSKHVQQQKQQQQQQQQEDPLQEGQQQQQQQQQSPGTGGSSKCNLTGTYKKGTDISSCSTVTVGPLTVPAGVTLDLRGAKTGATIQFTGTTTFGTQKWNGPLVSLSGSSLTVKGNGKLDGQGAWYWKQGQSIVRPVFFQVHDVHHSTLSGFTILNTPYRTFSIVDSEYTTLSGLTLDARAGKGIAKNTDGFDLSCNDHITITGCTIYNQDDCFAMQSSTNTFFTKNYCYYSHGISVGSLGGNSIDKTTTVKGLTVQGNHIIDSDNGLRIKTIIGLTGLVTDVKFLDNTLSNVRNAIVVHSDYSKSLGRYTGAATSKAHITGVTVSGLKGTATNLYDIVVKPDVVSQWTFSDIQVAAMAKGKLNGIPNSLAV